MGSYGLQKTQTVVQEPSAAVAPVRAERLVRTAWLERDETLVCAFALTAFVVHVLLDGRYGYFRDELYYLVCGQHLAWGYVDQAPLIAVVARLTRALFGDSLYALRLFPALSAGVNILLAGWIVRELGGRRYAHLLTATSLLFCPIFLTMDSFLSMNAFEPVFWMLCAAISLRIIRTGNDRLWPLFGLVAGIGILNKHSMLIFGLAFFLSLIVSRQRVLLRTPWIWLGAFISFLIFLPNFLWEARNYWPTIEILQNVDRVKNMHVTWAQFIIQQTFLVHPLGAPIVIVGLWFFLSSRDGEAFRFLGWTYIFLLAEFLILRGRIYYLAPIYPMLFAAGAVAIEAWIGSYGRNWIKV